MTGSGDSDIGGVLCLTLRDKNNERVEQHPWVVVPRTCYGFAFRGTGPVDNVLLTWQNVFLFCVVSHAEVVIVWMLGRDGDIIRHHPTANYIASALCQALCRALGTQRRKVFVLFQFAAFLWDLKEYLIALASNGKLICGVEGKGFVCFEEEGLIRVFWLDCLTFSLSRFHQWTMAFCAEIRWVGNL